LNNACQKQLSAIQTKDGETNLKCFVGSIWPLYLGLDLSLNRIKDFKTLRLDSAIKYLAVGFLS
jgi:hypothetical protein